MKIEPKPFRISVFGIVKKTNGEPTWKPLPATSEFLTGIQFVPTIGDWVSTLEEDWPLLDLDPDIGSFRSVLIVKRRVAPYFGDDVAVICEFQEEADQDGLASQWQRIPLN